MEKKLSGSSVRVKTFYPNGKQTTLLRSTYFNSKKTKFSGLQNDVGKFAPFVDDFGYDEFNVESREDYSNAEIEDFEFENEAASASSVDHKERMRRNEVAWKNIIPKLARGFVCGQAHYPQSHCCTCFSRIDESSETFCFECKLSFCSTCFDSFVGHSRIPHNGTSSQGPKQSAFRLMRSCSCDTQTNWHRYSFVFLHGIFEGQVEICLCIEMNLFEYLLSLGFFPSSPQKPRTLFQVDILELTLSMINIAHVSLVHITEVLQGHMRFCSISVEIYRSLIQASINFRKVMSMTRAQFSADEPKCLACISRAHTNNSLAVAFDGNFRTCRRANSGINALLSDNVEYFADQKECDARVEKESKSGNVGSVDDPQECHDFKAGDILRSKSRYALLDETGVFGGACAAHGTPLIFVNMKHGERFEYCKYLIEELYKKYNMDLRVYYDVACKFKVYFDHRPCVASGRVRFCINAFHLYGHGTKCHALFNPRRTKEFGYSDGECMERLWAFLGYFGRMTKEMRPNHRIDVLSDALNWFGNRIQNSIVGRIAKDRSKLESLKRSKVAEFQAVLEELDASIEQVNDWACIQTLAMISGPASKIKQKQSLEYLDLVKASEKIKAEVAQEGRAGDIKKLAQSIVSLEQNMRELEAKLNIETPWTTAGQGYREAIQNAANEQISELVESLKDEVRARVYLIHVATKHGQGTRQTQKVFKLVGVADLKIESFLKTLNELRATQGLQKFELRAIYDMESNFWRSGMMLSASQCRAIDLQYLISRVDEELELVGGYIRNVEDNCRSAIERLRVKQAEQIQSLHVGETQLRSGLLKMFRKETSKFEKMLENLSCLRRDESFDDDLRTLPSSLDKIAISDSEPDSE